MMLRSAAAALLAVSLLGATVACGRYGAPLRPDSPEQAGPVVPSEPVEPVEQQAPEESS